VITTVEVKWVKSHTGKEESCRLDDMEGVVKKVLSKSSPEKVMRK